MFFPQQLDALNAIARVDPLLSFGDNNYRAVLSPIGIIHLYREYFFEFDSFLGPPVGHVWLSPGGTVELVEVNTRKVITERTFETMLETVQRQETQLTTQDDIADAVKEDNSSDVKFGVTNTAKYSVKVFEDTATASFSLDQAKKTSRETTQKHMRQQSEKLSSEIKRNFKTTFRTSTEVTDTTSRRYVIANESPRLVNYELRRKMRKVGVQVQDIGVQLCWHTFVDDPGKALGVGTFVHLGEPPEMADLVHPDQPVAPGVQREDVSITIPFVGLDTDDTDNAYTDGSETEVGFLDSTEHIESNFPQKATFKSPGYTLTDVVISTKGDDAKISVRDLDSEEGSSVGSFTAHLDYVHWHDRDVVNANAALTWSPSEDSIAAANAQYKTKVAEYTAEKARRFKEAFIKSSRERIELASQIDARPAATLREEERTVVYRRLIRQLMGVGGPEESRHVISELVRSIFDVDKMLYFVAPEWWVPRLHRSAQHLGEEVTPPRPPGPHGGATLVTTPSGELLRAKMLTSVKDALVSNTSLVVELLGEGQTAASHEHPLSEHRRLGRRGGGRPRQLLHHREVRAREARQLARLADPARRRRPSQRDAELALGQGGDSDPGGQGARGDQLAAPGARGGRGRSRGGVRRGAGRPTRPALDSRAHGHRDRGPGVPHRRHRRLRPELPARRWSRIPPIPRIRATTTRAACRPKRSSSTASIPCREACASTRTARSSRSSRSGSRSCPRIRWPLSRWSTTRSRCRSR